VSEIGTTSGVIHRSSREGEALWAMGSLMEVKLGPTDSDAGFGVMVVTAPSGIATPLHVHRNEAEAFYVLQGSVTYEGGGELFQLEQGDLIYLPVNVPHRFRTTGDEPTKFLALMAPAGLSGLYSEVGTPALERRIPDPPLDADVAAEVALWATVAPRYGLELLGPPLPLV
jgi:quercetin dioxygenase-like cupin family protein